MMVVLINELKSNPQASGMFSIMILRTSDLELPRSTEYNLKNIILGKNSFGIVIIVGEHCWRVVGKDAKCSVLDRMVHTMYNCPLSHMTFNCPFVTKVNVAKRK